jgi:hypothetical protein
MAPSSSADDISRNKEYYPDYKVFLAALQDLGREDAKSKEKKMVYPKLTKVCGKIYDKIKHLPEASVGTGANRSRDVREMVKICLRLRKLADLHDVHEKFRPFAVGTSERLFIISNDIERYGVDSIIDGAIQHFAVRSLSKQEDRSAADAIRVAAVMLLPENQGAVTGILRGVKDRAKSDQSVDPALAWAMQAVQTFKDDTFIVEMPHEINPGDVYGIDPNDMDRFAADKRDGKWFLDTWKLYLKRKYKNAIGRWDKETGGGSRDPAAFADYCERGSRWLVWVYLMDVERDFLLFSNAKGKPPEYVGKESGFEQDEEDTWEPPSSSVTDNEEPVPRYRGGLPYSSSKKRKSDESLSMAQKTFETKTDRLGSLMEEVCTTLRAARSSSTTASSSSVAVGGIVVDPDAVGSGLLQAIVDAGKKKMELEQVTMVMSPSTRAVVLGGIERQIGYLGRQYREHIEGSTVINNSNHHNSETSPQLPRRLTLDQDDAIEIVAVPTTEQGREPLRLTTEQRRQAWQLDPDEPSDDEEDDEPPHPDDSPGDSRPRR